MKKTFSVEAECRTCAGTGLCSGMSERDGVAVVCVTCKGTGCEDIQVSYTPFVKRKHKVGIVRVLKANPGVFAGPSPEFGGLTIEDWESGYKFGPGTEMRKHTCPAWWYQTADYSKKPDWIECRACAGTGSYSGCQHFCAKEACWERWDKENQQRKAKP